MKLSSNKNSVELRPPILINHCFLLSSPPPPKTYCTVSCVETICPAIKVTTYPGLSLLELFVSLIKYHNHF